MRISQECSFLTLETFSYYKNLILSFINLKPLLKKALILTMKVNKHQVSLKTSEIFNSS